MLDLKDLLFPLLVAFFISLFSGPYVIKAMKRLKFGQQVRDDGPKTHLVKQNIPTIGGLITFIGMAATALIYQLNGIALIALLVSFAYGIVGFLDDFIKIIKKRSLGLRAYQKIIGQFGIAIIAAVYAYQNEHIGSQIYLPFTDKTLDLGIFYIPFAVFVIIAIVNAMNLTDGLDGLASGVTTVMMSTMMVIIGYLAIKVGEAGNTELQRQLYESNVSSPLHFTNVRGLATFCAIVVGANLGYLRYNIYPARIIMGDMGAFLLGGALVCAALFSKMALLLPIVGAVLVASCVSVILQVGSYKLRHKRIFLMAPLHHHFELKGYPETKVTAMYMLVTLVLCLLTLVFMS